jgi:putative peptidoglycan lipid II flippase
VIYEGGEFTPEQGRRVAAVLFAYAPAIWAYSMAHVLSRAFYARDDAKRPVRIALTIVLLNLVLNLILIWPLREVGLAASTAICSVIQVTWLLIALRVHARGIIDRDVRLSWLRSGVVCAVMAAGVGGLTIALGRMGDASWSWRLLTLAAVTLCGLVLVAAAARILRMPELGWALGRRTRAGAAGEP